MLKENSPFERDFHESTLPSPRAEMTMSDPGPWMQDLATSTTALRDVLGAIIRAERQYQPAQSPLALLQQITRDPQWQWLQPLYQLIADVDHASHDANLPATEVAAIGAHARALLSGTGAPIEHAFLERYRALLQAEPEVTMAHGTALRALQKLPPEPDSEAERLHAHHQWALRRKHQREPQ
jgi:hypothetical protein